MKRIIMENVKCMRLHVGFPLQFLVDVVVIFVYLIKGGPSSSLDGGILEEAWTSIKLYYSFLKTFYSEAFFNIIK